MSGAFDGYHVWLGIPPNEQPPSHYRLLGIAQFENDLDVIDHAADRQMAHVRTFQSGKHRAVSQQLLNELAVARVCLLTPEKKTKYDEQLRAKTSNAPKAVPVAAPAVPVAAPAVPVAAPVAKIVPTTTVPKATPAAASVGNVTPNGDRARVAKPVGAAPAEAYEPEAALTGAFVDELDDDTFSDAAKTAEFKIRPKRRARGVSVVWRNPVAVGLVAGAVVVSFFLLYYLTKSLVTSPELQQFILHGPPAADGELSPPTDEETKMAPPPPPAASD
jgi:hypothetical protein